LNKDKLAEFRNENIKLYIENKKLKDRGAVWRGKYIYYIEINVIIRMFITYNLVHTCK